MSFWAGNAPAARPFVTDDARVVERRGCQVETFYKKQHRFNEDEFWFLPACNPWGVELTVGANRINSEAVDDTRNAIVQGKTLLRTLETNGSGYAFTLGAVRVNPEDGPNTWNPFVNTIASFSFFDDRTVLHANLGAIKDRQADMTRATWGIGLEALLVAPRLYAILETYGQRAEHPTRHLGLRFWIVPNRMQIDSTLGDQEGDPHRRFHTIGMRFLF
jgi:hypothetical protein